MQYRTLRIFCYSSCLVFLITAFEMNAKAEEILIDDKIADFENSDKNDGKPTAMFGRMQRDRPRPYHAKPKVVFVSRLPLYSMFTAKPFRWQNHSLFTINVTTPRTQVHKYEPAIDNWCETKPCGKRHTLCLYGNTGTHKSLASRCQENHSVKVISTIESNALLRLHNSMRNQVALGRFDEMPDLGPATNMQQLIWDRDLADMAAAWLRQCTPGPDTCRSFGDTHISQLECWRRNTGCGGRNEMEAGGCQLSPLTDCVRKWFTSGLAHLNHTELPCPKLTRKNYMIVQLLWAETNRVGCAVAQNGKSSFRVLCNYAPGAPFSFHVERRCGHVALPDFYESMKSILNPRERERPVLSQKVLWLLKVMDLATGRNGTRDGLSMSDVDLEKIIFEGSQNIPVKEEINKHKMESNESLYKGVANMTIHALINCYKFNYVENEVCNRQTAMYAKGQPGDDCNVGRLFEGLCYDPADRMWMYRVVAVLCPGVLLVLTLHDLLARAARNP